MDDAASSQKIGKPIEVLLVEGNPGDVRLTPESFKESKMRNNMTVAGDGVEALALVHRGRADNGG
jgi:chemotaxis family two-component system response regulator Rcp1